VDVVVAVHAAGALLLLLAGLAKLARPEPARDLLETLGMPVPGPVARVVGVAESTVGLVALGIGGPVPAALTGCFYVAFVAVVVRAIGAGASSCGCFGRVDAPPSWLHVAGNSVFAATSFAAMAGDSVLDVMDGQPAGGIGFVLLVGVLAGLALVAFTALPEALGARHGAAAVPTFRIDEEPR
jgi:hypothetical protein